MSDPNAKGRDTGGIRSQPPAIPDHELMRCIGRGSYGDVWLARSVMGAYRAVKIVYRGNFEDDRPFEREFNGIQKFEPISRSHESQVDILHVGRSDGFFYYVMELADDQQCGQNIDPATYQPKTLKSEVFQKGQLPVEECLVIGLQLTTALNHLHSHGLIHRDIKPSNIIFINGTPKLADIGLVTSVDATRSFVGTEGFLPPEGPGTQQGDIYSLGKVLYELLSGRDRNDFPELPTNLFEAADRERFLEFNAIIAKACAPDLRERYASAQAMQEDLLLLQGGKSVRRARAFKRRLVKLVRIGVGLAVTTLLVFGAYTFQSRQPREAKQWKPTQIATVDPATGALTFKSPDGGSLSVLGVSSAKNKNQFWRPDGTPITNESFEVSGEPLEGSDFFLLVGREMIGYQWDYDPPAVYSRSVDQSSKRVYRMDQYGELLPGPWAYRLTFPKSAPLTFNWHIILSDRPEKWRTVSVLDPDKYSSRAIRQPSYPDFRVDWDFIDTDKGLQVTLILGVHQRFWKTRIVAVATNGIYTSEGSRFTPMENSEVIIFSHFRPGTTGAAESSETTQTIPKLSIAAVKQLRAEVQPVGFVEFRNIALQPKAPASR